MDRITLRVLIKKAIIEGIKYHYEMQELGRGCDFDGFAETFVLEYEKERPGIESVLIYGKKIDYSEVNTVSMDKEIFNSMPLPDIDYKDIHNRIDENVLRAWSGENKLIYYSERPEKRLNITKLQQYILNQTGENSELKIEHDLAFLKFKARGNSLMYPLTSETTFESFVDDFDKMLKDPEHK